MPNSLIIAHRGASGLAPENTLAAFRLALELGVDLIELDVHRTKDGHIVVIHDDSLDRTTDRSGKIRDLTLGEIVDADAGQGERVPTLHEALELMAERVLVLVEIKPDDITADVIQTIMEAGATGDVVLQSFYPEVIAEAFRLAPEITRGLLIGQGGAMADRASSVAAGVVVPSYRLLNDEVVHEIHLRGMGLWTYTVDEEATMRRMIELGVDGIITNYPNRLKEVQSPRSQVPG